MILRSECLYKDEIIGIESIYTVVNGKQINIPEKVEALRQKGREGLLTCPCGCGAKLILVAGDKNLRQQHFRAMNGSSWSECTLKEEGQNSVDSKVVIKCWLADKMDQDIQTRVPISKIVDTDRKYEVSHYVPNRSFAVNYTNMRINLEDEKLEALSSIFSKDIIHVVDIENLETFGQYPEFMIKIQNHQNYCLFLRIEGRDYDKAELNASFYMKDIDGLYQRVEMCEGLLKNYGFSEENCLMFSDRKLAEIYSEKKSEFIQEQENEKNRRDEETRRIQEEQERLRSERQKRESERKAAEEERQALIFAYLHQQESSKRQSEGFLRRSEQKNNEISDRKDASTVLDPATIKERVEVEIDAYIDRSYTDIQGTRWFKCTECGKVGKREDFKDIANARGTCKECYRKIHGDIDSEENKEQDFKSIKLNDSSTICPWCGSQLIKRNGPYGPFWGCSAFPKCTYKRKIYL